jgi:two-component system NarL family sensor kinase
MTCPRPPGGKHTLDDRSSAYSWSPSIAADPRSFRRGLGAGHHERTMPHTRRLPVLAVAWVVPIAWIATALLSGPADGTALSSSVSGIGEDRWGDTVVVARTYGDTPLQAGDVVRSIDGRSPGDWVRSGEAPDRHVGEVLTYEVQRAGTGSIALNLRIDVPLTRYPVASAMWANPGAVALAILMLASGSFGYWQRPEAAAPRAFLAAASLGPAALTAYPFGLGTVDLAGSRGVWPYLGGEALAAMGLGSALVAVLTLTGTPGWLRRHPWAFVAAYLVPASGWAVWLLVGRDRLSAGGPGGWQTWATMVGPGLLVTVPAILVATAWSYSRARRREDLLAARLALIGAGGGLAAWLLLGQVPQWLTGDPLVPWSVLALLLVPSAIGCATVAISRFRLDEIEPAVRRAAVQVAVAALVGSAFIVLVRAVDLASDISVESMLAGGLIAVLLLPAAVGLQRGARRLVYGDRDLPRRVVSDLRRLDPTTAPEDALHEMLTLLVRRLHLTYAAIEVFATGSSPAVVTSTGVSVGLPVDVDLAVGGTTLGSLRLEVDPSRDPFGPGDRRLLEDVGSQVGALVQAVAINRELQRSRQHLVAAREEERRRLRRDLHDGLGPALASLAMRLETAQDLIAVNPQEAADFVGRLSEQAREEIVEVRRLVDGLRPPALDQFGLVSALQQRADALNLSTGRTTGSTSSGTSAPRMTVTITAADDVEPLPAAVEVAAYRITLEAVNNALRHSGARTCVVTLRRDADALLVQITDSGSGLAEDHAAGVGLFSMRERAQELGGTCIVTSRPGSGTTVDVVLPIADESED